MKVHSRAYRPSADTRGPVRRPAASGLCSGRPMLQTMDRRNRKSGPACVKPAAPLIATLAILAATVVLGAAPEPPGEYRGRVVLGVAESAHPSRSLSEEADAAWAGGDLPKADRLYRDAWADATQRDRAAEALHRLHREQGFRLPIDEETVRATLRTLGPGFSRYESAHFVVLSDCATEWSRKRGELLEETRRAFFRIADKMHIPACPPREKLVCILFKDHGHYRAFARANDGLSASWVAGYYATHSNRVVFYNDEDSPGTVAARERLSSDQQRARDFRDRASQADQDRQGDLARRLHASADDLDKQVHTQEEQLKRHAAACSTAKTIHEAIHLLAFNSGLQLPDRDYPFWLSEGLATGFETEDAGRAFGPDRAGGTESRMDRFRQMSREGKLLPLQELIGLGEVPGWDGETAETMYS